MKNLFGKKRDRIQKYLPVILREIYYHQGYNCYICLSTSLPPFYYRGNPDLSLYFGKDVPR